MPLLGVDLRSAPKHPSAVAVLGDDSQITHLGNFHTDDELIEIIDKHHPSLVAIGTPLALPDGLCCLETTCGCQFTSPQRKGRVSEIELARMGISCFFTNKGSIIRQLIYRGIRLSSQLREAGYKVIEVYPHASKVILFGDKVPPKNSRRSLDFMRGRLPTLIEGLEPHLDTLDRNTCDALMNSYTALLHAQDSTDILGSSDEGLLSLPRLIR